jgi:DNA-binding NarL/FixJ family response regulator
MPAHATAPRSRRVHASRGKITIVLAETEQLSRGGVRCLLESHDDLEVVGEISDGLEVAGLVSRLRPRVLIIGIAMPGLNGLDVTRQVRQQSPTTAVLMLSRFSQEPYVVQALRNGAAGFVVKSAPPAELVRAIRKAVAGERYLSPPLSDCPLTTWLERAENAVSDPYDALTDREREVLQLIAQGHSSPAISGRLSISARTVEAHRANIMRKLKLRNLVDLIVFAITRGLVPLPAPLPSA